MWAGHLGTTKAAKYSIELTPPDAHPIHSVLYWDGPSARTFENTKFDRLLQMDVIEPS